MNGRWRRFLEDAGAVFDDGGVAHFGNPAQERQVATAGSVIADLSHLGLITARGADAARFLQGQLTNDVTRLDERRSQLAGYCNPQGRLLAILRLFFREDRYHCLLPAALLDEVLERLRKYVLMSQVTLEDASDALMRIGLSGPRADRELRQILGAIPEKIDEVLPSGNLSVIRLPGIHPRFALLGPSETLEKVWADLDVRAAPVGAAAWSLLDILAGIPVIHPQTVATFIPQSVNLELLGGVSFDKGCYTGQEIVARLHYRGSVKRRMFLAECDTDAVPQPGTPVYAAASETTAGTVVSAAPAPDGGCAVLAVLQLEHAGNGASLHLGERSGPSLRLRELPYPVPGAGT